MKELTKRPYVIAANRGLVEGGEDAFHQIVYRVTGKEHVSELNAAEGRKVERELLRTKPNAPPKYREEVPGMMTDAQQRYAWRMIYRLIELDKSEESAAPDERLAGAVRKTLGITASAKEPLKWVDRENGSRLIEALKRIVRNEERKARNGKRGTANGY